MFNVSLAGADNGLCKARVEMTSRLLHSSTSSLSSDADPKITPDLYGIMAAGIAPAQSTGVPVRPCTRRRSFTVTRDVELEFT